MLLARLACFLLTGSSSLPSRPLSTRTPPSPRCPSIQPSKHFWKTKKKQQKQSAALKQTIEELEASVEAAAARTAELEEGTARAVENGVRVAKEEAAGVRRRLEEESAATAEAKDALGTARADLDKARRELKQRGQLARNLLADKDAEINRLRAGGSEEDRGGGGGGPGRGAGGGEAVDVNGGGESPGGLYGARLGGGDGGGVGGGASSPMPGGTGSIHGNGASPGPRSPIDGQASGGGGGAGWGVGGGAGAAGGPDGTYTADGGGGGGGGGGSGGGGGRKRLHGGGGGGGGGGKTANHLSAAESHHAEQQILQMARVQAQRDEETGRLRLKIQRLSDEIKAREERLSARDEEKDGLRRQVEELRGEAARAKELLDEEHGAEKMTYLKNVVKKFVMSDGTERKRLVPVVATILSFSPAETMEVDRAVTAAVGGGSSWGSVFG